jgi:hypothetical protein
MTATAIKTAPSAINSRSTLPALSIGKNPRVAPIRDHADDERHCCGVQWIGREGARDTEE